MMDFVKTFAMVWLYLSAAVAALFGGAWVLKTMAEAWGFVGFILFCLTAISAFIAFVATRRPC